MANRYYKPSYEEHLIEILVISALGIALLSFIIIHFDLISKAWYWLRFIELKILSRLPQNTPLIGNKNYFPAYEWLRSHPYNIGESGRYSFDIHFITSLVWLPTFIATLCCILLALRKKGKDFKKNTGLTLLHFFSRNNPWLKKLAADKPWLIDPRYHSENRNNEYAQAMRPAEFSLTPAMWVNSRRAIFDESKSSFDESLARKVFESQLDNKCSSKGYLNLHARRIMHNNKEQTVYLLDDLYDQLSRSELLLVKKIVKLIPTNKVKPLVACLKKTGDNKFQKPSKGEQVLINLIEKHRYTRPLILSFYEYALTGGPILLNQFLYLAKEDRSLFLALCSVGRDQSFAECAGIINHWRSEKALYDTDPKQVPLKQKDVESAVNSLKAYLETLLGVEL